ncbi:MAG: Dam family site-specific DNA-(adenine-N6)-methyltransferase [Balneola sp.]
MNKEIKYTKPFLRWAGGKKWLIKELNGLLKNLEFNNYHEIFLGGGAVFFSLEKGERFFLSDINEELINCYQQVKNNSSEVISKLKEYENTKEFYYSIRKKRFDDPIENAAKFIFLNQTSFNGIYRVNLKGEYNVPYGYRSKTFLDENLIEAVSQKLSLAEISAKPFWDSVNEIQENDLVFLDPPYTITHNNNGFIKYNEKLFSEEDQYKLSEFIGEIIDNGAYYILTNAAHSDIRDIFYHNEPIELSRASLVGGKEAKRGKYKEFLFTNIENGIY